MARKRRVPTYLEHKGTGQGYCRITVDGKQKSYYFGEYNTPESIEAYREFLAELGLMESPEPTPDRRHLTYSLAECVLAYQSHSWDFYGEGVTSEAPRIKLALSRLLDVHDHADANQFGPRDLKKFQQHLVDQSFSRTYVNATIKRALRFFRWLVSEDYILPSVQQKLETVQHLKKGRTTAPEPEKKTATTQADFLAVLEHLNPVIRAMVTVQRYTGMRPGEVCKVRPCDIDRTGECWIYRPAEHKTANQGKTLIKAIPLPARVALEPYLEREPEDYCFSPAEALESIGRTPGDRKSKRLRSHYTTSSYRRGVVYGFEKAELAKVTLTRWTPLQLRKLAATESRTVLGLESSKDWLGHADSQVTEEHYAEVTAAQLQRIAAQLENHWRESESQPDTQ